MLNHSYNYGSHAINPKPHFYMINMGQIKNTFLYFQISNSSFPKKANQSLFKPRYMYLQRNTPQISNFNGSNLLVSLNNVDVKQKNVSMKFYLVQNQEFLLHCQPVVFSHVYLNEYILFYCLDCNQGNAFCFIVFIGIRTRYMRKKYS